MSVIAVAMQPLKLPNWGTVAFSTFLGYFL